MALPNLSQISEALDNIMPELTPVPVGTVAYAHEVPTGWLQCNGAEVSRTTYARLFRKIGTKYGAGNGSTTFNLPDLQHRVLEGTNTTSEVAQKVEAGLPDINGNSDIYAGSGDAYEPTGCFQHTAISSTQGTQTSPMASTSIVTPYIEAQRCSPVYGKSGTVQMASVRLLAIIKI